MNRKTFFNGFFFQNLTTESEPKSKKNYVMLVKSTKSWYF